MCSQGMVRHIPKVGTFFSLDIGFLGAQFSVIKR
jgi:hypothetical protein